jgi:sirohydrochlorin ferrochelatase
MPENNTESTILIAIGRIEEKVDNVQRGQERLENKFDAQDVRLTTVERDITELKTQRDNKSNTIAIVVSVVAVLVAALSLLQ